MPKTTGGLSRIPQLCLSMYLHADFFAVSPKGLTQATGLLVCKDVGTIGGSCTLGGGLFGSRLLSDAHEGEDEG